MSQWGDDREFDPFEWEDEDDSARCRYCGAEIDWGNDEQGRPVPFRDGKRHNCRIAPSADDFEDLTI